MENAKALLELLLTATAKEPWLIMAIFCLLITGLSIYAIIVVAQSFAKGRG